MKISKKRYRRRSDQFMMFFTDAVASSAYITLEIEQAWTGQRSTAGYYVGQFYLKDTTSKQYALQEVDVS